MGTCTTKSQDIITPSSPPLARRQYIRYSTVPVHTVKPLIQSRLPIPEALTIVTDHNIEYCKGELTLTNRLIVKGALEDSVQQSFTDKRTTILGQVLGIEQLSSLGIGIACKKGLKSGTPNQDDFSVIIDPNFSIFSVFDGHGNFGHEVAHYVKEVLPSLLIASEPSIEQISAGFTRVNEKLQEYCAHSDVNFDCELSGTTATLGLIRDNVLYMAHVGDSRAVLGVKTGLKHSAIRLTTDHKPNDPAEQQRVFEHSGEIKRLPGDLPFRIFGPNSDLPGLSISRAIGDSLAQTLGVVPEPELTQIELSSDMEYLLICTDGVWDFVTEQEALSVISRYGNKCKLAAEKLASTAWTRWIQNEEDVVDDITVIVVYLPWQHNVNID